MEKIIEFMIKLQCVKERKGVHQWKIQKEHYIKDIGEHDSG